MLNVKKRLNQNLGRHGKYSNSMLKKTARIKTFTREETLYLGVSLPKKSYLNITMTTYLMLWDYDKAFLQKLLNIETYDEYPCKEDNKQLPTKAITPIQTNIFLRAADDEEDSELVKFSEWLSTIVLTKGGTQNV